MGPDACQIYIESVLVLLVITTLRFRWALQMPEKDIEAVTELPYLNDLEASDQGNLKASSWVDRHHEQTFGLH